MIVELTIDNRLLKKFVRGRRRPRIKHPTLEKLKIIRVVEESPLLRANGLLTILAFN